MDDVFFVGASKSCLNAFAVAGMLYYDLYGRLEMVDELDLFRVRLCEAGHRIREIMYKKYPEIPVQNKILMSRPVGAKFKTWEVQTTRLEFRKDIDMSKFIGNQKWQMYCLEKFLEMNENNMNVPCKGR